MPGIQYALARIPFALFPQRLTLQRRVVEKHACYTGKVPRVRKFRRPLQYIGVVSFPLTPKENPFIIFYIVRYCTCTVVHASLKFARMSTLTILIIFFVFLRRLYVSAKISDVRLYHRHFCGIFIFFTHCVLYYNSRASTTYKIQRYWGKFM